MSLRRISRIVVPLTFLLIVLFSPPLQLGVDLSPFLTIVSLMFTILVGFFMATAATNYLRLQTLVAQEDANLISMYNLCKIIQPSKSEEVAKAIDEYATASLNHKLEDYVEQTETQFDQLTKIISGITPSDGKGTALVSNLQTEISQGSEIRREAILASRRVVSRDHWVVLILLGTVLGALLLSLKGDHIISNLLTSVLMSTIFLVLLLIYEVDSNRFLEEKISYGVTQRVFEVIGSLKYFPKEAIDDKVVLAPKEKHRVGVPTNSPTRDIKVVG